MGARLDAIVFFRVLCSESFFQVEISFFPRWVPAGTQYFEMDFDELPAGGVRPQPVVDVAGPLVRDMRQRSKGMPLSLDVPALQTAKGWDRKRLSEC